MSTGPGPDSAAALPALAARPAKIGAQPELTALLRAIGPRAAPLSGREAAVVTGNDCPMIQYVAII